MWISRRRRSTIGSGGGGGGGGLSGSYYHSGAADGAYFGGFAPAVQSGTETVSFALAATATFDYDPFTPTHTMEFDWRALGYLDPANTFPSWGDAPTWTPQVLGTVTATGDSASSVVWSIDSTDRNTMGLDLVTSTPGQCTIRIWFDRDFHNSGLGPSRTFTLTGTVGATVRTCTVTLNVDLSAYNTMPNWPSKIAGITHPVGCDYSLLTPLNPSAAPTNWEYVDTTYTGFVAGVRNTGLSWRYIRPTADGATLDNYDCSGVAFRNDKGGTGHTNVVVNNCLFDGSVWGSSPIALTTTTTVNPDGIGSKYATVGSLSGLGANHTLVGNSDYPANTYVECLGIGVTGDGTGGSAVITGIADTSVLSVGWTVLTNAIVQTSTTIASIDSPTQITLSKTLVGSQTYSDIYLVCNAAGGKITLSNAAIADSGAVSTDFLRGTTMEIVSFPVGSTKTVTFNNVTIDCKGEDYPWFTNALVTRHPNQTFNDLAILNHPNDGVNFNGGTFSGFYTASIGTNNRRIDGTGYSFLGRGFEANQGEYWGHCDGVQGFNVDANFLIEDFYADLRWYHIDPATLDYVAGATAPLFLQINTTGSMTAQNGISRGGTYGIQSTTGSGNQDALTTYKNVFFDGLNNLGQIYSPPRPQLQAYQNYYLLDWVARYDCSQPVGGNAAGAVIYTKGQPYGSTLNPDIVAPAATVAVQGSDYIRFGFTPQASTKYEGRWRTTAGPGVWSSWEAFEDQTLLLYVPGGSASPDLSPSTGYDIEIRGYNDTCVAETGGTRLIADGPATSLSITTAAAPGADASAAAILTAWTTAATVYERDAVYNLVADLKAGANAWGQIGHLFCAAAGSTAALSEQRSLFNWKDTATTYTKSGTSPAWRAQYGGGVSAGGAGAEYIDTGWKPGYSGDPLASQNSMSFFRYMVATDGTPSNVSDLGNVHNAMAANNGTNMRFQNSSTTADTSTASESPYLGMLVMSRDNSADYDVYFADPSGTLAHVSGSPFTRTSTTPTDSKLTLLGQNTNTAGGITMTRSSRGYIAFAGGGSQLTITQAQEMQDAFEAFLDWFDVLPA